MSKVRLGIIGYGNIGSQHGRAIRDGKTPQVDLTAVADIDEKRLELAKSIFGEHLTTFTSASELIHSGLVDAVLIAVPHYEHPSLAIEAMEAGADILKLFPGDVMGPKMIKAIRGPLPYVKIMPTGGVDADNVGEWIKAGAVAVGAGSCLTAGAKTGDYESITKIGQKFIENIKAARA